MRRKLIAWSLGIALVLGSLTACGGGSTGGTGGTGGTTDTGNGGGTVGASGEAVPSAP